MARIIKTSFNAGEFSERLYGRVDLEKYASGNKTMRDFVAMPHGGATRRPGFKFINETKTSSLASRLIPFNFSTEQAYIIEAGKQYMRFYMNGGQIQTVDSNTKLLLHMEGIDYSTSFVDNGSTDHTANITIGGNAKIRTNYYKFSGSSGYLNGTSDFIKIADHADWDLFAETNATIEGWFKFDNLTGTRYLIHHYESATDYWALEYVFPSGLFFIIRNGGVNEVSITYPALLRSDVFYHIAVIKVGNNYGIYLSGQQGSYASTSDTSTRSGPLYLGIYGDEVSGDFQGYMDEIRIYHGNPFGAAPNAGLSDTIVPPSLPYPAGPAGGGTTYELVTSYLESELEKLKWVQSADILFITSPDRCPRKLSRTAHDSWNINDISFDSDNWPPFLDKNLTATTITPSGTTGSITLTASAPLFNSEMVGGWFALASGYCKVTGFTDTTHVDADVVITLSATDATADWWEGAWSDYRGWPTCATFYEDRLCFAGPADNPDRIDLSTTSGYENFYRAELTGGEAAADDAMVIYLASRQVNAIRWLAGTRKLLVGTTGGEWWIDGGAVDEALDATAFARRHMDSEHGSADIAPVLIGNKVVFIQRLARTLREFYYNWQDDQYTANDMSILSEHLTNRSPLKELAWQQGPHQLLWGLRYDGVLLPMTYMREHDVIGWSRVQIAGTDAGVESIAVIEGETEDELYAIVRRTINSATKRYIEKLEPLVVVDTGEGGPDEWELSDAFFVDSGLTYRGVAKTTFDGLSHLEGENVVALADGVVFTGLTVSSGEITLPREAAIVHIGLNYVADLEPLWPINSDKEGLLVGYPQKIQNVVLMIYKTCGGKIGPDPDNLVPIEYPMGFDIVAYERAVRGGAGRRITRGDDVRVVRGADSAAEFYTGLTEDISIKAGYHCYPTVYIRQDEPLPMTVVAVITEMED